MSIENFFIINAIGTVEYILLSVAGGLISDFQAFGEQSAQISADARGIADNVVKIGLLASLIAIIVPSLTQEMKKT